MFWTSATSSPGGLVVGGQAADTFTHCCDNWAIKILPRHLEKQRLVPAPKILGVRNFWAMCTSYF